MRELSWAAPLDIGFWARAQVPPANASREAGRAAASGGYRFNWSLCEPGSPLGCDRVSLSTAPQFRSVSDAPTSDGRTAPAVGLALVQDAETRIRPGIMFRAGAEIGAQIGSEELASDATGPVAKARAGATLDLRKLGAEVPLRVGVSLAVAQNLGPSVEERRADHCQGAIEIRYADYAPLRFTAPCDAAQRDSWIGFGVRGQF